MWTDRRSLGWVFISRMIGIICFLIVIVFANILLFYVSNPTYHAAVEFLNTNFWLLLIIGIILFIGDIFRAFPFPLDLPYPVIKAIGSVFIIAFVLRIFEWVDHITANNLYHYFWLISFVIVPLVFIVVIVSGYYEILRELWARSKFEPDDGGADGAEIPVAVSSSQPGTDVKTWDEIGAEFRLMLYDIIHRFREEIHRKNR
ncbi:MAG: hypothetical protein NTZ39_04060 [Methanoregula sp.]|nr:hypothetical protein [Methanoregula sp.]